MQMRWWRDRQHGSQAAGDFYLRRVMLGFQAEGFPDTFDRFFKLYNAKPFDVFKYFNLTAIQSVVDAIRNGAGRNVPQQLQFEAQMALHVLGLNQYVTE